MKDRYSIVVGLIFLALVVVAAVHTLNGGEPATLGLDRMPARWPLPEFAVPNARGSLKGDATVAQADCEPSALPCPADERRPPACEVHIAGAIRVCDLFDRPLVLSFWFAKGGKCVGQQDV